VCLLVVSESLSGEEEEEEEEFGYWLKHINEVISTHSIYPIYM